jgi:hypothetical protein
VNANVDLLTFKALVNRDDGSVIAVP